MASIRAIRSVLFPALSVLPFLAPSAGAQCMSWDSGFGPGPNGLVFPYYAGKPSVWALATHDDGSGPALYVGGQFYGAGSVISLAVMRWNGIQWSSLAWGADYPATGVFALCSFDDGSGPALYAGGIILAMGGQPMGDIARWNGASWSPVGVPGAFALGDSVRALCAFDPGSGAELYATGGFERLGNLNVNRIARWNGSVWQGVGGGLTNSGPDDYYIGMCAATFDDGSGTKLYVGGYFNRAGSVPVQLIAAWDGTQWHDVGGGMLGGPERKVEALCVFDDGSGPALYAGGDFASAGGHPAVNVARWNGSTWSNVGAGLPGPIPVLGRGVRALTVFDDGSGPALYAAAPGTQGVVRWNGSVWAQLSGPVLPATSFNLDTVSALAVFDDGQGAGPSLFAGGYFSNIATTPSNSLAEWHGCNQSPGYFCAGDGVAFECPCNNNGLHGRGCENSDVTGGASLVAGGTTNPDMLSFSASGELPSSTTTLIQGDRTSGFVLFGDGLRCIGGSLRRLYVKSATSGAVAFPAAGDPSISARSAALGDVLAPGAVRVYQAHYRDPIGMCTWPGGRFNSTNAARILW